MRTKYLTASIQNSTRLLLQSHCDFVALRTLLLATHMQDMVEVTHTRHYENFRVEKLGNMVDTWNEEVQGKSSPHSVHRRRKSLQRERKF